MPKRKICFIYNPVSGTNRTGRLHDIIHDNLDHDKYDYVIRETKSPKDAIKVSSTAVNEGFDIIVAVGGDGTVNEVIQGIGHADVVLGIIPGGSGNGLARHLLIPLEAEKAIQRINKLNVSKIDIATINGYPFASIAGLGFDARVASKYRKVRQRGFYGYFRVVIREFFRYRERTYKLTFDENQITRKALLLCIANSNQFGYNSVIAPDSLANDGLLDIVVIKKFPLGELPRMIGLLFTGKINQSSYFETFKTKEVFIERKRGRRVNIDGEAVRLGRQIFVRIQPSAIKIIT